MWLSVILVFGLMFAGSRKKALVPVGIQNVAECAVDFVRNGIIMQTIGPDGLGYMPFLLTMFIFIFVCNIWEIIPVVQMPVNARIALPLLLALLVWVIFNVVGIVKQGFFGYFKNVDVPARRADGRSTSSCRRSSSSRSLIVRPLSLSVRLFANMLAGHLLLVDASPSSTAALWSAVSCLIVILPFSFALLVALTGFEVLVVFLQAFIFTILTAVYIGGSMHPEH